MSSLLSLCDSPSLPAPFSLPFCINNSLLKMLTKNVAGTGWYQVYATFLEGANRVIQLVSTREGNEYF